MDRNLALNMVRVTEAAALASAKYLGRGEKDQADQAAVDAMRKMFDTLNIDGTVVIGEGEIDEAPMLYIGERIGKGNTSLKVDIAVDPVDGTTSVAKGRSNAIAIVAIAPEGCLLHAPDMYMDKIAVGPEAKGCIDIEASVKDNLEAVAKALNKDVKELTVTILERDRHLDLIKEVREVGSRIKLYSDGDVATAIATCITDSGIDVMMGVGGAPEGVIAAAALKSMGGDFQGKLKPLNDAEKKRCKDMGIGETNSALTMEDLVKGNEAFFAATGISDGDLLNGVTYLAGNKAKTHSMVTRSETGTVRFVEAMHSLNDKPDYAY